MEQRYRGYPQAQSVTPQPYMIYNREENDRQNTPRDERWRMRAESDYFRGLYPPEAKRLRRVAEAEFDRIDKANGPMYDEYPDREFLYQMLDRMLTQALAEGITAERDLM